MENLLGSHDTIYQKELNFFSKYLSVLVSVCIITDVAIGHYFPESLESLAKFEYTNVSIPILCSDKIAVKISQFSLRQHH